MLPQLGKIKSVKDIILNILFSEQSLTARKIYSSIKKNFGKNITYQAAYKALSELTKQGVLIKKEFDYSLNKEWIDNIGETIEKIKKTYSAGTPNLFGLTSFNQEGGMQTYIFDCLSRAEEYRKSLQTEYFKSFREKKEKYPYCSQSKHLRSPLVYSEKSLSLLNIIKESGAKCYMVITGNSTIDEWCADFYKANGGIRIKTGINCAEKCDIMILGDIITQLYFPEEIHSYIEETYKSSNINQINTPEFFKNVYERKIPIKIVVFKNAEIAEQLRKQVMDSFRDNITLFNMGGTLLPASNLIEFIKFLHEQEKISNKNFQELKSLYNIYLDNNVIYNEFVVKFLDRYAISLKGVEQEEIKDLAKQFIDSGKITFYPYAKELVETFYSRGKIIAVSGFPSEVASLISENLRFDDFLATELGVEKGKYTGTIKLNMALKETKKKEVEKYISTNTLSLANSYGFGNTFSDLPILEIVENVIAVNPDKELEKYAKIRGWKILHKEASPEDIKNLFSINKTKPMVKIVKNKTDYVAELMDIMSTCSKARIITRDNITPYFLYPQKDEEYIRIRGLIKGQRDTFTHESGKDTDLKLFKVYKSAWESGKEIEYISSISGLDFFYNILEKNLDKNEIKKIVLESISNLKKYKVKIKIINNSLPTNIHITPNRVAVAILHPGGIINGFISTEKDVVDSYNALFDTTMKGSVDILDHLNNYLKRLK